PSPGYTGETLNGIHEIAGGLDSGGTFGAPVSLGCIRLNKFQAMMARWGTPKNAKIFVHFEPTRYPNFGDIKTGKARTATAAYYAQASSSDTPSDSMGALPYAYAPQRSERQSAPVFPFFGIWSAR